MAEASWYGVIDGGDLVGVSLVRPGRLMVAWCPRAEHARALGAALRAIGPPTLTVGPRHTIDALWPGWAGDHPIDRWFDQRMFVCEVGMERTAPPGFRLARPDEWFEIAALGDAMEAEDTGRRPMLEDRDAYLDMVKHRIHRRNSWLIEERGQAVFVLHAGMTNQHGVQIGGTYVPPFARGRGLAAAGTAAVTCALLASHPRVTLHVNEANTPAVRTYERANFRPHAPLRLVLPGQTSQ
jgi:hypothetical protein